MPEYRPDHEPVAMLEFDAHEASRIYAQFAVDLKNNADAVRAAILEESLRLEESRKRFGSRVAVDASPDYPRAARERFTVLVTAAETRAEIMAASVGRAWLPMADVGRLLRMKSGEALAYVLETGRLNGVVVASRKWDGP